MQGDLVDIHTFTKFFTFQIDRPQKQSEGVIKSVFRHDSSAGEGFLFRLRAELSASYSDQVQQGMRVSLIDEDTGFILADGSSIDDNEGVVRLDYHKMEAGKQYHVKYEFFDKQLTQNNEISEVSFSMTNTQCKLPFVSQELLIQDIKLVKARIAKANNAPDLNSLPLNKFRCDFEGFNNTLDLDFGEQGIFCERTTYTYPNKAGPQELVKLYEHPFTVRGNKNELVTYWYEMLIGYNFMVGSGLKVLLSRNDLAQEQTTEDPFACLYDKSCVLAQMSNKNQLKIDVILTSGEYTLTFYDQQSTEVRRYMADEGALSVIPFTFKLTSYPVLQNEERVNCPYMFLDPNFIQNMFIDGMQGQRFHYSDKVILNVFNLTQIINIRPSVDSVLKVKVKEAYGVNADIVLCEGEDCITNSMQIGTSELLMQPVKKDTSYTIELGYANSIITVTSFFQCPHINYEITMIPESEALTMVKEATCTHQEEVESEEIMNQVMNSLIENKTGAVFQNYHQIFTYDVNQKSSIEKTQNYEVTSKKFVIGSKMQLFMEVFYEPYLYDLEIFLQSSDVDLVRSHIYKAMPKVDWSLYKGAKSIFVELEPGEYEVKVIQKIPGISAEVTKFQVSCVRFQLRMVYQEFIDKQNLMPNSLNYYGMLGPKGKNFGQMVYFCQDCVMEDRQFHYLEFSLNEDDNLQVNFDAVIDSGADDVSMILEEIKPDQLSISDDLTKQKTKGKQKGVRKVTIAGNNGNENDETVSHMLTSQTLYRITLNNKNYQTKSSVQFTLRVDIQEKVFKASTQKFVEQLPTKIEEIQRFRAKAEGMKESEFYIGTKFMHQWINENALHPFVPKSTKTYQTKYTNTKSDEDYQILLALPFEVKEEEAQIFAQVQEYTGIASLSCSIIRDSEDSEEEFESKSVPGKYHSYIRPITLTKGKYYFIVEPQTTFPYEGDSIIRFGLDFVYSKEAFESKGDDVILNSMELCGLSGFPYSLNSPQYMHALTGNSLQFIEDYKIDEILMGASFDFELSERSLVVFYMQIPKEMNAFAEITKTKGTNKIKLSTKDINKKSDNFLRQKDLAHVNVIEVREFLNAGQYRIKVFGSELEEYQSTAMSRCQSFKAGFSITPTKVAEYKVTDQCLTTNSIGNKMTFDQIVKGNLTFDLSQNIIETTHIVLDQFGEGPFLFYFSLNYDTQLEGPLAITLNKYSADTLLFEEVQIFEAQDSQSQIVAIVEEGTYVIGITSLSSTLNKFDLRGLGKQENKQQFKLMHTPCLKLQYTYFISSMTRDDSQIVAYSFTDLIYGIFNGDLFNNMKQSTTFDNQIRGSLKEGGFLRCRFDDFPSKLTSSESGYDHTYTFKLSKKNYEIIDIVVEEDQLLRVFVNTVNPKNNVNVFLYGNAQLNNLLAYTENSKFNKNFLTTLKAQKKAYKLKIVFDSLDETDECPLFDLRVAMKPINNLVEENLACTGAKTPPEKIQIKEANFDFDQQFAFSGSLVQKHSTDKGFSFDIDIVVPNHNYYFDIEAKFDFLTTNVDMFLLGREETSNKVMLFGYSQYINEEGLGDSSRDTANFNSIKKIAKRLRIENVDDLINEGQNIKLSYRLKLKFSKQTQSLLDILKSKNQLRNDNEVCFPFDLSIRATENKPENANKIEYRNELVRIDWSSKLSNELIDPRQKLSAFLQFRNSMKDDYKNLKFVNFVYLIPEDAKDTFSNRISPMTTRLSTIDKSSIVITFKHDTLERGKCYLLKIDGETLALAYNEQLFANQTRICTTNCLCNPQGTKKCDEALGKCECHYPYTGEDCSECGFGHVLDEVTKQCVPFSKCKENGGEEDCNGHGTCYEDEQSGVAKCDCDEGFTHDGNDMCAQCVDPLFSYPNCAMRFWVIEPSNFNCKDLKHNMPRYLYQNGSQNETYQNEEGFVYWSGTYRLVSDQPRKKSVHYFQVNQNSVLRFFFDTLDSGVKVRYSLIDDNKKIIMRTTKAEPFLAEDTLFQLLPQTTGHKASQNPFILVLEYEYSKEASEPEACPMIDLYLVVQPMELIQSYLQCSSDELKSSKKLKQFSWQFGSNSQHFNERFTLTSDMRVGDTTSYFSDENENFYIMKYQLNVQRSGNALSVMAAYNFESVSLAMTLIDLKTNNVVAIEKIASLEDIDTHHDEITLDNDMITYLEVASMDEGLYELQILVMKALFLPTNAHKTCLNFDLTLEYVSRTRQSEGNEQQMYEVIRVFPSNIKSVNIEKGGRMEVKFNKALDIDTMIQNQNDLRQICYLQNMIEQSNVINPYKVIVQPEDSLSLYFNFKNAKIHPEFRNYKMKCTTQFTVGKELISPMSIDTTYTFPSNKTAENNVQCNPWALPKIVDNKCQCSYPYTGPLCEQCETGFNAAKDKKTGKHTICVLDQDHCSKEICNNHGQCLKGPNSVRDPKDFVCQCESKYDGQFCEKCKNPAHAYPDCSGEQLAGIYDSRLDKEYLNRRQYSMSGYEKNINNKELIKNQKPQCSWTNYPQDLDRVEYMNGLGGQFHIADYFTINHDHDNIIKFTPKTQGIIKIFAQQPEQSDMIVNDELFDLEIGIYDLGKDKFLVSKMNQHLVFGSKHLDGKLEYAYVDFQVPYEYINTTLYIMFRAVNFSVSSEESYNSCAEMYLEIEFRETRRECQYAKTAQPETSVTRVSEYQPFKLRNENDLYSVYNTQKQFFYYKDFYLGSESDRDVDFIFEVNIEQKFMEKNQIDFLIEMLDTDVDYEDINQSEHPTDKPQCNDICILSGQKSYNEFHNALTITSRTYFRFWLFQLETDGSCGNFQMFLDIKPASENRKDQSLVNLKCEELDMPKSLNTPRYLGDRNLAKQQNFQYLERFRIDNLANSTAHRMMFELKEPTLVRFVAPVHKHIEFDMELRQLTDGRKNKKLITSAARGFEDSIFAQLDAGRYYVKFMFMAEQFYMNKPCQAIEVGMAMMTLSEARRLNLEFRDERESPAFTLESIINSKDNLLKVKKFDAIKTYNMDKITANGKYDSYVELYKDTFKLPSKENLGVLVIVQSDFLFNDINFVITNVKKDQVYHNIRRENLNKVVLDQMPGGEYELLIYTHNCLTNLNGDYLQSISIKYQIDFNLVRWATESLYVPYYLQFHLGNKVIEGKMHNFDENEFKCYQKYEILPDDLNSIVMGNLDFSSYYQIPATEEYSHEMTYIPQRNEDSIRIVIDRPNVDMELYLENTNTELLAESFSYNGGQGEVLVVRGLRPGSKYIIKIDFTLAENFELFQKEPCQQFKMSVLTTSEKDLCLKETLSTEKLPTVSLDRSTKKKIVQIPLKDSYMVQRIEVTDDTIDLEISIDYSNQLYMPDLKLNQRELTNTQLSTDNVKKQIITEVKPSDVELSIKQHIKYKYVNLKKGVYAVAVIQNKFKDCPTRLELEFTSYKPLSEDSLLEQEVFGQMKVYTATTEIQDQNRFVDILPVSLNTYKYAKDDPYMLISEYVQYTSNQDSNKFTFKIQNDDTFIRFYLESDELMLKLRDLTREKDLQDKKSGSITAKLSKGDYEISLQFFTPYSQKKAEVMNQYVHYTMVIAEKQIYQDKYQKAQGIALSNCDKSTNFPLALNKKTDKAVSEAESVYDYPHLRISPETLSSKFIVDTYSFRVNETSRFYMNVGMHMLNHQVNLVLSDLKSYGNSYAAKQQYNLNTLDVVLSAGDYALVVDQPSMLGSDQPNYCGIFSFGAKITPLSLMNSQKGEITQSKCEIKEVLPYKIYNSEQNTKNGFEYFINSQGTFFRRFESVLFKKSRQSQTLPEYDRVQFSTREDGIISLLFQYKQRSSSLIVKLFDGFTYQQKGEPLIHKIYEAANGIAEETFTFQIQKDHEYTLLIYYQGELTYDQDGVELCEYYDVAITINHLSYLAKDFQCLENNKNVKSIMELPSSVTDKDFTSGKNEFKYQQFLEVKYPADFNTLSDETNKELMVKAIDINLNQKFNLDTSIKFDFPDSIFEIGLYNKVTSKSGTSTEGQLEEVGKNLPLTTVQGNNFEETLIRQYKAINLIPKKNYILAVSQDEGRAIFDLIYEKTKQNMCLYVDFSLQVTKQATAAQASIEPPLILSIFPKQPAKQPLAIDKVTKELRVSIELNQPLYFKKTQGFDQSSAQATKNKLAQIVSLQAFHPQTKELLYSKQPFKMYKEKTNGHNWSFIFNIEDEYSNKDFRGILVFNVDTTELVNAQNKEFKFKEGVTLPTFMYYTHLSETQKKKEQEEHKSEIQLEKLNQREEQQKTKTEEVKCLCVHGTCPRGSQYCDKCEPGWEGKLCDIRIRSDNINQDEEFTSISNRLKKPRMQSNKKTQEEERRRSDTKQASEDNSWYKQMSSQSSVPPPPAAETKVFAQPKSAQTTHSQGILDYLYNFFYQVIVVVFFIVAGGISLYLFKNRDRVKDQLRAYMPVQLQDRDDDEDVPKKAMELSDLRSGKGRKAQDAAYANILNEEDDEDEDTRQLQSELMLYADTSEQDQAQMLRQQSPETNKRRFDGQQPQHVNEQEAVQEIDSALQEMGGDSSDDDNELQRFF